MHGGDCGSSICRNGGGPTQALTSLAATASRLAGGDGDGLGLAPAPAPPAALALPSPVPLTLAACPGGAFLMTCRALGENSAAVGGAPLAALSSSGRSTARATRATPRLTEPAVRPGRRSPREGSVTSGPLVACRL